MKKKIELSVKKTKCIVCNKEFYPTSKISGRKLIKRMTCSKDCSKIYNRITSYFWSKYETKPLKDCVR